MPRATAEKPDIFLQELAAMEQATTAKQAEPTSAPVKPRTLGSTLITLGIVAGVCGLLLVPLMSK